LPVTCPYRELEDLFLLNSNDFYENYQPLFNENPEYFCHFLKSDDCLFSEILTQRTKIRFETLHVEKGLSFMKSMMHNQLQKLNLQELTQCEKQSFLYNQRDEVDDFMENVVRQVIEEVEKDSMCKEISNFSLFSLDSVFLFAVVSVLFSRLLALCHCHFSFFYSPCFQYSTFTPTLQHSLLTSFYAGAHTRSPLEAIRVARFERARDELSSERSSAARRRVAAAEHRLQADGRSRA